MVLTPADRLHRRHDYMEKARTCRAIIEAMTSPLTPHLAGAVARQPELRAEIGPVCSRVLQAGRRTCWLCVTPRWHGGGKTAVLSSGGPQDAFLARSFVIVLPRCLPRRPARLSWALSAWCRGRLLSTVSGFGGSITQLPPR
jgi:hypothetical protein